MIEHDPEMAEMWAMPESVDPAVDQTQVLWGDGPSTQTSKGLPPDIEDIVHHESDVRWALGQEQQSSADAPLPRQAVPE